MDKVLKQRLVGASILIALAVIFLPMLFDGGSDTAREQRELTIDVPERDSGDRQVRRLALDPAQARRPPDETQARSPEEERAAPAVRQPEPPPVRKQTQPQPAAGESSADDRSADSDDADRAAEDASAEQTAAAEEPDAGASAEDDRAEAPASEPPADDAPPASEGDWVVQVAVFSSRETANSIRQRLGDLGHRASMEVLVRDQAELFRLRTGPYADEAAAKQAQAQIATTVAGVDPVVRELSSAGPAADRHGLAVQVGSFASRKNAERLVGQLNDAGFDAFMYGEETGGRTIWRVRVGSHEQRADAEALLETLREEQGLEGIVVSHP